MGRPSDIESSEQWFQGRSAQAQEDRDQQCCEGLRQRAQQDSGQGGARLIEKDQERIATAALDRQFGKSHAGLQLRSGIAWRSAEPALKLEYITIARSVGIVKGCAERLHLDLAMSLLPALSIIQAHSLHIHREQRTVAFQARISSNLA